jgi:hypothetical protein
MHARPSHSSPLSPRPRPRPQIIIAGPRSRADTQELLDAAHSHFTPDAVIIPLDLGNAGEVEFWRELNPEALAVAEASGVGPGDAATAFICQKWVKGSRLVRDHASVFSLGVLDVWLVPTPTMCMLISTCWETSLPACAAQGADSPQAHLCPCFMPHAASHARPPPPTPTTCGPCCQSPELWERSK